jgi:hypothetical protein
MREKQLQRERERERQRAKEKAERERKSVGKYTIEIDEEGGDMMHAIPSWTQPVTSNGNWDDVSCPFFLPRNFPPRIRVTDVRYYVFCIGCSSCCCEKERTGCRWVL